MSLRLRNLRTILSLVLAIVVSVFWIRSYFVMDALAYGRREPWKVWNDDTNISMNMEIADVFIDGMISYRGEIWFGRASTMEIGSSGFKTSFHWSDLRKTRMQWTLPKYSGKGYLSQRRNWDHRERGWYRGIIAFPHWLAVIVLLIGPAVRFRKWVRARQSIMSFRCRKCGYDLRETPERCPECGAMSQKAPAA